MTQRKKAAVSLLLFAGIFGGLLAVATMFDLQIDRILTRGILAPGMYYTNSAFGAFFEIIGDCPLELVLGFAIDILFIYALRFLRGGKRAALLAATGAFSVAPGYALSTIVFNRVEPHLLLGQDAAFSGGLYLQLLHLFFGLLLGCLGILAVNNFSDASIKRLLPFSVAAILFAAASTIAINLGLKEFFGRMRFRSMNVVPEDAQLGFSAYSRWYVPRGHAVSDAAMRAVYGHTDANKSIPSGHTGAAGISYALILLNSTLQPKKKGVRAAMWILPLVFTGMVAVSRMMVGAHFMSDVLIGGTLSFVLMILCRELVILKGSNLKALFGKE